MLNNLFFYFVSDNCIKVGSKGLGRWTNGRYVDIYHKAVITGLASSRVTLTLDETVRNRQPHSKSFYKTDSLAFVMDQVPDANELKYNTRVVALFNDEVRYFSGKIWYYSLNRRKYVIRFDDKDWAYVTPSRIRLLKRPPPYC